MAEQLQHHNISMAERQRLIAHFPCFSELNPVDIAELAAYFVEEQFAVNDILVRENEWIEHVYIIYAGTAEVSRQLVRKRKLSKKERITNVPVAILTDGEAIGLNDTGFFSETGKRTATVTALSAMSLLRIEVKTLHQFLQARPTVLSSINRAADKMLKMQLIKQSLPFSRLSHDKLQWLCTHVEELAFPAGAMIFSEGDVGDRCYLIRSGEVEILTHDNQGDEHSLTILRAPTLFGEATLITRAPRNASARAVTNCQLLVLRHQYLAELLNNESDTAEMFMALMVDRSRPSRNPGIVEHHRDTADHQPILILKNPSNGVYFKLSAEGKYIWQCLDGQKTLHEITMALANDLNIFAPDMVAGLIAKLARSGFIQQVDISDEAKLNAQSFWVRAMLRLRAILEKRVAIGNADQWVTTLYNKIGFIFFTRLGFTVLFLLALSGALAFGCLIPHVVQLFKSIHSTWYLLILLIPFTIISVVLHELGHAFATKYNGHEVRYMGVGWYWFGPVAFTDTSDMWLSTRWPRIMVNLAGIYSDIINAGVASLLILIIHNPYVQCFLWLFAFYTYVSAFRMLSPLQDLDGYYVLMDVFDKTRLRQSAVVWLVKGFPKAILEPSLFKGHAAEICYWLACIIYLALVTLLTLLAQDFVLHILGLHASNALLSLALPFLVVILSSLNIIADIRSQAE